MIRKFDPSKFTDEYVANIYGDGDIIGWIIEQEEKEKEEEKKENGIQTIPEPVQRTDTHP